jgi:hypothetical protein
MAIIFLEGYQPALEEDLYTELDLTSRTMLDFVEFPVYMNAARIYLWLQRLVWLLGYW